MKKLTEINSFLVSLIYLGIFVISGFAFKTWISIVPEEFKIIGVSIIITTAFGIYFHWLYIIGLGLNNCFLKYGKNKDFNIFKISLLVLFINQSLTVSIMIIYLVKFDEYIPYSFQVISSLISLFCIYKVIVFLTEEFKYLDRGITPNFWDFIITTFQMFFIPIGLIILHSHMRLLNKDESIKKTTANKKYSAFGSRVKK